MRGPGERSRTGNHGSPNGCAYTCDAASNPYGTCSCCAGRASTADARNATRAAYDTARRYNSSPIPASRRYAATSVRDDHTTCRCNARRCTSVK